MRRLLTIGVGALIAVSVPAGMLVESGTAQAAGPQISCTKLAGGATSQAVSKCSGPAAIIGSKPGKGIGSGVSTTVTGYQAGTITTWGAGGAGGTSTAGANYTSSTTGACGTKALTIVETGTVVSGTGAAAALVGDTGSATLCVKGTSVKLLKGTTLTT